MTRQIIVAALPVASIGFVAVVALLVRLGTVKPDKELAWVMTWSSSSPAT